MVDFPNSDLRQLHFIYNDRVYLLTKIMTVPELIDKLCDQSKAQKNQIFDLKKQLTETAQQLADAVVAAAADNTAHQAEATAMATKLQQELDDEASKLIADQQKALATKIEAALAEPKPAEPPLAFEQVAPPVTMPQ